MGCGEHEKKIDKKAVGTEKKNTCYHNFGFGNHIGGDGLERILYDSGAAVRSSGKGCAERHTANKKSRAG